MTSFVTLSTHDREQAQLCTTIGGVPLEDIRWIMPEQGVSCTTYLLFTGDGRRIAQLTTTGFIKLTYWFRFHGCFLYRGHDPAWWQVSPRIMIDGEPQEAIWYKETECTRCNHQFAPNFSGFCPCGLTGTWDLD